MAIIVHRLHRFTFGDEGTVELEESLNGKAEEKPACR